MLQLKKSLTSLLRALQSMLNVSAECEFIQWIKM